MQLQQLETELEKIALKAKELDKIRGEHTSALFDQKLFSCLSKQLLPCVKETQNNFTALICEQEKIQQDPIRIAHLCERLFDQISALQRELNTLELRKKENQQKYQKKQAYQQLNQDLLQHQEWERRLKAMITEAERKIANSQNIMERQQLQHYLLTTEKRLDKCMEARQQIENKISYKTYKG